MAKRRKRRVRMQPRFFLILFVALASVIIVLLLVKKIQSDKEDVLATTPVPTATAAPTATPKPALPEDITVTRSDSANPAQFGFSGAIKVNGKDVDSFKRSDLLNFGRDNEYSVLPGVTTFGGNTKHQCKFDLQDAINNTETIFYEMFVKDVDGKLVDVPVRIANLVWSMTLIV